MSAVATATRREKTATLPTREECLREAAKVLANVVIRVEEDRLRALARASIVPASDVSPAPDAGALLRTA